MLKNGVLLLVWRSRHQFFYRIGDLLGKIDELLSSLLQRYPNYGKGPSTHVTVSVDFKDIYKGKLFL